MKLQITLAIAFLALTAIIISSCQSEDELNLKRYYVAGQLIYQKRCQNCHGTKGDGLGALIPPFSDSVYLNKNRHKLACFVKNGLADHITVNGKPFMQQMPAQRDLSNIQVAQVLTYINNSFNNKMGLVDVDQVNEDLGKCTF